MSTLQQDQRTGYAKFVAAARWLRANGYTYDRTEFGKTVEWRWWDKPIVGNQISIYSTDGKLSQFSVVGNDFDFGSQDTTVAQAIDFLVVAGILPVEFGSWEAYTEYEHARMVAKTESHLRSLGWSR